MGRHQNQAVKRARERNKKLKAEDKRAKRQKRKEQTNDAVETPSPQSSNGPSVDGAPPAQQST
jgi:hypothetical protein